MVVLNDQDGDVAAEHGRECTIIVTGVARGGTSMLAQALDRLGLFLGDSRDSVVVEDTEILDALQNTDMGRLEAIIADRNQRFARWGFKVPNIHKLLPAADQRRFRNPRYVVAFRDPLAIARRNELSMRQDAVKAIREAGENIMNLTSYVCTLTAPVMLISYEKALQNAEYMIKMMSAFCGLRPREEQEAAALAAITPNGFDYIAATQLAQSAFKGTIDKMKGNILRGWCCHRDSERIVEIEVFVDGRPVGVYPAEDYREDLANAAIGSGCHAFNVDLTPFNIGPSNIISVRPVGDTLDLPHSFRPVKELRTKP
jgi:hypothetical protein